MDKRKVNGYDPVQNAIVQSDAQNAPENKGSRVKAIRKEYHTYNVEALENSVGTMKDNIKVFEDAIRKEEEAIADTEKLIAEGKERDGKLLRLMD